MFTEIKGHSHIEKIITDIQEEYCENQEIPWIIGFSGGKDSTVLLTLTWIALRRIQENNGELNRRIHQKH